MRSARRTGGARGQEAQESAAVVLRCSAYSKRPAALSMVSATPSTPVPGGRLSRTEDLGVEGLRPLCYVAKSDRRAERSLFAHALEQGPLHVPGDKKETAYGSRKNLPRQAVCCHQDPHATADSPR